MISVRTKAAHSNWEILNQMKDGKSLKKISCVTHHLVGKLTAYKLTCIDQHGLKSDLVHSTILPL